MIMKELFKFAIINFGGWSLILIGTIMMLKLCVDN